MKNVFKVMLMLATFYCTQSLAQPAMVNVKRHNGTISTIHTDRSDSNNMLYRITSDITGTPVGKIKLIHGGRLIPKNDDIIDSEIFTSEHMHMVVTKTPVEILEEDITKIVAKIAELETEFAELEAALLTERMLRDTKLAELDVARLEQARLG